MELLAGLVAALSVFFLFLYTVRVQATRPAEARLQGLAQGVRVSAETDASGSTILRREHSAIPAVRQLLNRRGYAERWSYDLARAGLTLRSGEYFLMRVTLAVASFTIVILVGREPVWLIVAAVVALAGFTLPALWVSRRIRSRVHGIEKQLVEALTLIANAQRSGFAFAQGVDLAASRLGPPISVELNRMLLDINLGASTEGALTAMSERVGSDDLDLAVTAILIHRQTGGNLAEILDMVTETMRDRERIKGEIKTLTASQQLTGWVLSAWPLTLALLFLAINPGMMSLLWTTTAGLVLLGIWFVLNIMGVYSIRRILNIDI